MNPNNFDWFLAGIDQNRLQGILGDGSHNNVHDVTGVKMEDTFLMVRDDAGGLAGAGNL